jgi:hypothetical protein
MSRLFISLIALLLAWPAQAGTRVWLMYGE